MYLYQSLLLVKSDLFNNDTLVGRNVVMFCRQVVSINHLPTRKLGHGSTHPLQNAKSVNSIQFYILKPSPIPHQLGYGGWGVGVGWGGGLVPGIPPRFVNDMALSC